MVPQHGRRHFLGGRPFVNLSTIAALFAFANNSIFFEAMMVSSPNVAALLCAVALAPTVLGKVHDTRPRVERGARLVEPDVAVHANAQDAQVDGGRPDRLVVLGAASLVVLVKEVKGGPDQTSLVR